MLYRIFWGSFIFLILLLVCLYFKGFMAASLRWVNEQPEVCIEIGTLCMSIKRSRRYSAENLNWPNLENTPVILASLNSALSRLNKIKKISGFFLRCLIIQRLEWKSALGCGDAMYTALANGTLWGVKGSITALLSSRSRIEKLDLFVRPEFSQKCFESRVYCIFKMRIVHIIFVTIYFIAHAIIGQCINSLNRTRNRRG